MKAESLWNNSSLVSDDKTLHAEKFWQQNIDRFNPIRNNVPRVKYSLGEVFDDDFTSKCKTGHPDPSLYGHPGFIKENNIMKTHSHRTVDYNW